jgi:hypothetical protein
MGTTTTTFTLNKPTVGGDDNAWGTDWNTNADKLDDLLDGTTAIKPNLSEGLWKVGGVSVTSTAAELNLIDGSVAGTIVNSKAVVYGAAGEVNATTLQIAGVSVTSTAAELNILDGVTSTAAELNVLDGIAGIASQAEAEAGSATDKLMTPQRVSQAISALSTVLLGTLTTTSGSTQTLSGLDLTNYKWVEAWLNGVSATVDSTFSVGGVAVVVGSGVLTVYSSIKIDLATGIGLTVTAAALTTITSASTSISITTSAGTFDAGSVRIYGVK